MPRKFDDAKKEEWLELHEQGKTEKWIAHRAGCDSRTVKKAINEARLKRDVVVARVELVKDALRKHQDSLLEEIDQIISGLVIPPKDFAVLSWHRGQDSVFNDADEQTKPKSSEDRAMRRLLREHLRQDKLWKVLAEWEKVNANHMAARIAFQRRTAALLEKKTGYKLIDGDDAPSFVCSYTAGPLFYKAAIDMAFATPEKRSQESAMRNMETAISINAGNGHVSFENRLTLAVVPGSEQRTKQHLLDALKDLAKSHEVKSVVESYLALEQITTKTKQVLEYIRLLGLILGQCGVCRRLGM